MKQFILTSLLCLTSLASFAADEVQGPPEPNGEEQVRTLNDNFYDCYKHRTGPGKPTEEQCDDFAEQAAALVKVCDGNNPDFRDAHYQLCDNAHNLYRSVLEEKLSDREPDGLKERIRGIVSGAEDTARSFLPSFMRGCDFKVGSVGAKTTSEDRLHGLRAAPRGKGVTCTLRW